MALKNDLWQDFLGKMQFAKLIQLVAVDEAHCITQWGDHFRKTYSQLGSIRNFLPRSVPFMALSATLPPHVLTEVRKSLSMSRDTLVINLGNNRPNIKQEVIRMKGTKKNCNDVVNEALPDPVQAGTTLPKKMIFCNTREQCHVVRRQILAKLPRSMHNQVAIYHSMRSYGTKKRIMREFNKRNGHIRFLICTEAAGMVSLVVTRSLRASEPHVRPS